MKINSVREASKQLRSNHERRTKLRLWGNNGYYVQTGDVMHRVSVELEGKTHTYTVFTQVGPWFSIKQFELQTPISQLFNALKSHFCLRANFFQRGCSEQSNKTHNYSAQAKVDPARFLFTRPRPKAGGRVLNPARFVCLFFSSVSQIGTLETLIGRKSAILRRWLVRARCIPITCSCSCEVSFQWN